jgi:hypothetical protein
VPKDELTVHWKTLGDTLIASIRFVGQFDEISEKFGELAEGVGPHINGKAFTLYRGGNPKTGYDVEVCLPVSQRVDKGDIKSRVLEGAPYYRDPERGDDVIFIDKAPQEAAKHKEATDPAVKRAAACHCPIIKAAIQRGEKISPTFCNCGTGWFKPLWEAVLGRPVRITCEESVL